MKKTGMAAITVAALLSLSHARADDITGDILYEDCIVASHWSGSDRDCDIYINGLAAGVLVDQVAKEQGTPICFPPRVKAEQVRNAVEKFVQEHPDLLHVNGHYHDFRALDTHGSKQVCPDMKNALAPMREE